MNILVKLFCKFDTKLCTKQMYVYYFVINIFFENNNNFLFPILNYYIHFKCMLLNCSLYMTLGIKKCTN